MDKARIYGGKTTFKMKTTAVLNALLGATDGGFQLLQDEGATVVIDVSVTGEIQLLVGQSSIIILKCNLR